ncbi:hypothetical protein N9J96_07025 [Paracoccaceae bacterium]|nr:hypothetical protein [Paracoccaceae bacterium]MDA9123239.1 hypothetical protein [Paracoccaceae bacterium]MDC1255556.1 hypothetical protein [Paracoccaceae bacterium]MDE2692890.1 hypothetical protein [Paracoccaceae bacterium]|tara:strand:- start:3854 stop:3991 length:138 start_codon:yes stop_codon:yes gene_type:complete
MREQTPPPGGDISDRSKWANAADRASAAARSAVTHLRAKKIGKTE